jgi:hypothetical protein
MAEDEYSYLYTYVPRLLPCEPVVEIEYDNSLLDATTSTLLDGEAFNISSSRSEYSLEPVFFLSHTSESERSITTPPADQYNDLYNTLADHAHLAVPLVSSTTTSTDIDYAKPMMIKCSTPQTGRIGERINHQYQSLLHSLRLPETETPTQPNKLGWIHRTSRTRQVDSCDALRRAVLEKAEGQFVSLQPHPPPHNHPPADKLVQR